MLKLAPNFGVAEIQLNYLFSICPVCIISYKKARQVSADVPFSTTYNDPIIGRHR